MSNLQCSALTNAMRGKGMTYGDIAAKIGKSTKHVQDICTGVVPATAAEFNELAQVLDIKSTPPHDQAHATK